MKHKCDCHLHANRVCDACQKVTGQEKDKEPKNPSLKSPARGKGLNSAHLAKVIKKAAAIADLMTTEDIAQDLKVLRDAKKATHHVYDTKKKKLVKVPDHKTRLAATTLSRAYHEGKPVERSIGVQVDAKDFPGLMEKLNQSPAYLEDELCEQKAVEGKESATVIDVPPSETERADEQNSEEK